MKKFQLSSLMMSAMKMVIVIFILTYPLASYGKFYVSPGVSVTLPHNSDELSEEGDPLVDFKVGLGIDLEAEVDIWGPFSFALGGVWRGGEAISQYSYTDLSNPLDTASVEDMKTHYSSLTGYGGLRLRFVNLKKFKSYLGGGITRGQLILTHDENKFIYENGTDVGFHEKEEKSFEGHYLEVGLEFLSGEGGSLKVGAKQFKMNSEKFKTLGERALSLNNTQISILYMHPL